MYIARTFMWIEHSQEKNEKKGLAKKNTRKEKKNMNFKTK